MRTLRPALAALTTALALIGSMLTGVAPAHATVACPAMGLYSGGWGTPADPYLISTPGGLSRLLQSSADWGKSFLLTSDIDMGGCSTYRIIERFTGTLDGGGHVISRVNINSLYDENVGLIGQLTTAGSSVGTIRNLGFTGNVTVALNDDYAISVGGLVGQADSGTVIQNSFATGDVNASGASNYATMVVSAAGGLVGTSYGVSITDSFARGDVTARATNGSSSLYSPVIANAFAGGLVGQLLGSSTVLTRTWASGVPSAVRVSPIDSGNAHAGGLIGANSSGTFTGAVWNADAAVNGTDSVGAVPGVTGKTAAQMTEVASFTGSPVNWPTASIVEGYDPRVAWGRCPEVNDGFPFLSAFYPTHPCPPPPTLASVAPASGAAAGGTSVVITGTWLTGATSVTFGGARAVRFTVDSSTQITAITPSGTAQTAVDVAITAPGGSATLPNAFAYDALPLAAPAPPMVVPSPSPTPEPAVVESPIAQAPAPPALLPIAPAPPATPPGPLSGFALVNGQPAPVSVVNSASRLSCTVEGTTARFSVARGTSRRGSAAMVFQTGAPTPFSASGLRPGTPVTVYAMSTPVLVGSMNVNGDGTIDSRITLPASLRAGRHTLAVSGYLANGEPMTAYVGIITAHGTQKLTFPAGSARLTDAMKRRLGELASTAKRGKVPASVTLSVLSSAKATSGQQALAVERARAVAAYLKGKGVKTTVRTESEVTATAGDVSIRFD